MQRKSIVIDASVQIDMFFKHSCRHDLAEKLAEYLIRENFVVRVPMHSLFEVVAVFNKYKARAGSVDQIATYFTEQSPLSLDPVPVDIAFFSKYLIGDMPLLKAGDLLYVLLARGDGLPLITEDDQMYKEARSLGVSAWKIREFLDEHAVQNP